MMKLSVHYIHHVPKYMGFHKALLVITNKISVTNNTYLLCQSCFYEI